MSKISVKKSISEFTPEQLRGLILDIYTKSKEAKELLDFFAEPDIDKLLQTYTDHINKETFRIHRHIPAPRVSKIKALLKKFSTFEPGYEAEAELRLETLRKLIFLGGQNLRNFTESQHNSIVTFTDETCRFLDKNDILKSNLSTIEDWIKDTHSTKFWLNGFHNGLKAVIDEWKETT